MLSPCARSGTLPGVRSSALVGRTPVLGRLFVGSCAIYNNNKQMHTNVLQLRGARSYMQPGEKVGAFGDGAFTGAGAAKKAA